MQSGQFRTSGLTFVCLFSTNAHLIQFSRGEFALRNIRFITMMAVFIAIGTIGASFLWFPAGVAKAYPVQHAINVIAAITLGPIPGVVIAFMTSLLRNMLGLGTILAFPGAMFGALLAGLSYKWFRRKGAAFFGEVFGTSVIGGLAAVPIAYVLMGSAAGVFAFMPAFFVSSITGAIIGVIVAERVRRMLPVQYGEWKKPYATNSVHTR